ncbi:Hypothetical predicted protein [Cloeon dipterum]|uniref:Uncharacterized protein n=1 Tax=Cloeon dipterum TaxID=197152 RepID=A0A8S1EAX3_9INSE|nr:Hypothetical predicted protein [Cloeon dipterum]
MREMFDIYHECGKELAQQNVNYSRHRDVVEVNTAIPETIECTLIERIVRRSKEIFVSCRYSLDLEAE